MYINTFKYTPADVDCKLCTEYVKKFGCTACGCPWMAERIEAGVVAYVTIPKDLSRVQSKVLFGLTKRQVICFGAAAVIGVPLFFLSRGALGTTTAALCMILVMLPFFLFAMYQRNGQPLEVFLGHLIQNKFLRPKVRIYQTNNLYSALVRQYELEQEVRKIAGKSGKTRKNGKAQA